MVIKQGKIKAKARQGKDGGGCRGSYVYDVMCYCDTSGMIRKKEAHNIEIRDVTKVCHGTHLESKVVSQSVCQSHVPACD